MCRGAGTCNALYFQRALTKAGVAVGPSTITLPQAPAAESRAEASPVRRARTAQAEPGKICFVRSKVPPGSVQPCHARGQKVRSKEEIMRGSMVYSSLCKWFSRVSAW